jgi:aminomethyltransferase
MNPEEQLKRVPLHDKHIELGAKMVPFAGYIMPVRYSSDIEEHNTVRNGVGVFDVSHMGEFLVRGPKALDLIQKVTTNDAAKLYEGKIQYSCLPNDKGGIVDDLLVYCLGEQEYMLVVNASNIEKDWNWIQAQNREGVEMINISEDTCLFAVQGPKAIQSLQPLTKVDLSAMEYYTFVKTTFAGIDNVIVSATGYTGAGGFEIYAPKEYALELWDKIFASGAPQEIKPIGLGARDTLRLEMGFCLYGNDIDDQTSPLEAGLGWITKFNKEFTNVKYFEEQKKAGIQKKLVAFQMIDRGIPRSHYEIVNAAGENIGTVTSGTQSPSLSTGIGMGYVKLDYAQPGSEVFVVIRNKPLKAQVVKLPFYKKEVNRQL